MAKNVDSPSLAREQIEVLLTAAEPRRYRIVVQPGLMNRLGEECQDILAPDAKILLLTDSHLAERYLPTAMDSLKAADFEVIPMVISAGEHSKSLAQAQEVYETALQHSMTRKDAILGLGGGVIGDLAGFCASTYHRGIAVIHAPTTLVAQVDSAIGGKTAVNFGKIKNNIGTFHQPLRVLSDTSALDSLPERELAAGMAEVIKYGLIETSCMGTTGFFTWLLNHAQAGTLRAAFPEMIRRCCEIKAAVVMQDELETKGLRFFLNLGHTFGHAYESLSEYGLLHGEAVAIGMQKALRLSTLLDLFPAEVESQLETLYRHTNLLDCVQQPLPYTPQALLEKMRLDKKNRDANIRLILPVEQPGKVVVRDDIPDTLILKVLAGN
ncbi:MAG: 3-dehydroquinate synthase [Vampirovibrio sp.]|jgi:3-dehydroquinate synthase|nr:3-dehydroquinate synthase [Vampirovibrio sp.]